MMNLPEDREDRELQSLIMQAGEIKSESHQLRGAIEEFRDTLKRGMFKASIQGVLIVILSILFSITLLGLLNKPYTCGADNLSYQIDSWHYKVCNVIFPSTSTQAKTFKKARDAAAATDKQRQEILDERKRINDIIDAFPAQLKCMLLINPEKRTDQNLDACFGTK